MYDGVVNAIFNNESITEQHRWMEKNPLKCEIPANVRCTMYKSSANKQHNCIRSKRDEEWSPKKTARTQSFFF